MDPDKTAALFPTASVPSQVDNNPSPGWISGLATVALLAPIVTYFGILTATSVNIPYLDDYDTILGYLQADQTAGTLSQRLQLILEPHVEHRLAFVRGIALLSLTTTETVDFRLLAGWGNFGLLALTGALFGVFRRREATTDRLLLFLPVSFLLFQPQAWDAWFWATSSLSNLWVLPLALLTFIALDRGTTSMLFLAFGLGAVAVVTQANGLLVLPIGCGILLLRRQSIAALVWGAFSILVTILYWHDLSLPSSSPTMSETVSSLVPILHYAVNFLGSAAGFGNPVASFLAGVLVVFSAVFFCIRDGSRNLPLLALLALLISSALLNAVAREHIGGPDYALEAPRYRSYAAAVLAVTYLAWAESAWTFRQRQIAVAIALAIGIAFNTASYAVYLGKAQSVAKRLEQGLEHWEHLGRGLRYPHPARANAILAAAVRDGLYHPPLNSR